MYPPVLVSPPEDLPVTLEEMKLSLRWGGNFLDGEIEAQIKAAVNYYEGRTGILGILLSSQEWRQDFDRFERCLPLPLGPVQTDGLTITARNSAGQLSTIGTAHYSLRKDMEGSAYIEFASAYEFPTDLADRRAVSITYIGGFDEVPDNIKSAIKSRVKFFIDGPESMPLEVLRHIEAQLTATYGRYGL